MFTYLKSAEIRHFLLQLGISIFGVLSALGTLYLTLNDEHYFITGILLCLFLVIITVVAFLLWNEIQEFRRIRRKSSLPGFQYFPFDANNPKFIPWRREEETAAILNGIHTGENNLIIVTGPSGAGKTVLLREIAKQLKENRSTKYVCNYNDDFFFDYKSFNEAVIILDQFEQIFLDTSEISISWFQNVQEDICSIVDRLTNNSIVIIGITEEKFYLLKYLGGLLPALSTAIVIGRENREDNRRLYNDFTAKIRRACHRDVDFPYEGYTMLELQAYGALIELSDKSPQSLLKKVPDDVLSELIHRFIEASPNKSMSARILYALKQSPSGIIDWHLVKIIDDDKETIRKTCNDLIEFGLIRQTSNRYELSYSALQNPIEIYATERLSLRLRDTVQYSTMLLQREIDVFDNDEDDLDATPRELRKVFNSVMYSVAIIAFLMVFPRLIFTSINWYTLSDIPQTFTTIPQTFTTNWAGATASKISKAIDIFYFAIAVPGLVWWIYIFLNDFRVFRFGDTTAFQRAVSLFTLLFMSLCLLVPMVRPEYWISAIAVGGIVFGIKCLIVSFKHRLIPLAIKAFRMRAYGTIFLMFGQLLFGVFYIQKISEQTQADAFIYTYIAAVLLFIAFLIIYNLHLTNEHTAYYRSLLRTRKAEKPSPEQPTSDASPT